MRYTFNGVVMGAALFVSLLVTFTLAPIVWEGLHLADDAEAAGALDAARDFRQLSVFAIVLIPFLIGAAGLTAFFAVGLVVHPVQELTSGLERAQHQSLRERFVPTGPLEVVQLTHAVNMMAETLASNEDRLKRAVTMETIDALLNGVAHEIRTPLTSIRLDAYLVKSRLDRVIEREDLPASVVAQLQVTLRTMGRTEAAYERIGRLTRSMQEVVRPGADADRDINLIVHAASAIGQHRTPPAARTNVVLGANRRVICDASDLFHIVHALLVDAAAQVKPDGLLEVHTLDLEDLVQIIVRHTGQVATTDLGHLLDDVFGATGIDDGSGLVQARRMLGSWGGGLTCRSIPDFGTEWTIELPAAPGVRPERSPRTPPRG